MSILHGQKSFLETNAWQKSNLNSLRYNTSQVGSVLPIIYGTTRQQVNLIALGDYRGPSGKKGKNGPLPLAGTHTGKGGAGGGKTGGGGKKSSDYSVDVDFAICQGPVDIGNTNQVWASPGIAFFQSVGLNLYTGEDGQAADPVFAGLGDDVGYSGTCHVTGTPMDLGSSPVLPNLSFEVTGLETGTAGSSFPKDANPANVVEDFLTNIRYGAGWPTANIDPDISTIGANNYGDYCVAALFAVSPALQAQTDAATWVSELARLTNVAIVWSGSVLKFIPYGDTALSGDGATWTPNLVPLYSFTDDDFLPWNPHIDAHDPQLGEDDPVLITRANPADATNWMSIEYLDRDNSYNKTIIPQFDQAAIDQYGIRTEAAIQGSCFCDSVPAENALRLLLQRALYVRNTYRFQVGWQYSLLEPMDIVLLTDERCGLDEQPARITAIEENENGDLIVDAEEIKIDVAPAVGCLHQDMTWRFSTPQPLNVYNHSPDKIDKNGNYYINEIYGSGTDNARIYDPDGNEIASLSYDDLWNKIFAATGVYHGPASTGDHYGYYGFNPIYNGEYVLAYIVRRNSIYFTAWWALLDPDDLSVLGAYFYYFTVAPPAFGLGGHAYGVLRTDQPILWEGNVFLGLTDTAIIALPSIDEFLDGSAAWGWTPYVIQCAMLYPFGGTTTTDYDFGRYLYGYIGNVNRSADFGFILPDSNGGINLYIYFNRAYMDRVAATSICPPALKTIVQPANPLGCMIKIPLGNRSFSDIANSAQIISGNWMYWGEPTGAYAVDNTSWVDQDGATAIPFTDEYTHISDDSAGGADVYSMKTGVIDRGNGIFWVVFYMVGQDDAFYRNYPANPGYAYPIYERLRVFEYTSSTETAREIARITCTLHNADETAPDPGTAAYDFRNDAQQIFSAEDTGRVVTISIHGYHFKKAYCTISAPVTLAGP